MSGPNFSYINQFKRNGHSPLPQAKPQPLTQIEWLSNGQWVEKPIDSDWAEKGVVITRPSNVGKSLPSTFFGTWQKKIVDRVQVQVLGEMIKKYPRPPQGPARFLLRNSIPRGISDKHPFGDPSIQYFGHRLLGGQIIRRIPTFDAGTITREGLETLHQWLASFVRTA